MRKIYRLLIICLSTAGLAFVGSALADDLLAPKAAAAFEKSFPDFEVAIVDSLTLKLGPRGHQDYQINLDRIDRLCRATPEDCDRLLHDFVTKVAETVRARSTPPTLAALRAVVRPADYVREFKKELGANGAAFEPISEPIAGDLVALCYLDMPTTMRVASTKDIVSLGLTPTTAMQTCKSNVKTALKPLQEQLNGSPMALGYLRGDPYESSYFLFHDAWAPLAAGMGVHCSFRCRRPMPFSTLMDGIKTP